MRKNRLRELIKNGLPSIGTRVLSPWPGIVIDPEVTHYSKSVQSSCLTTSWVGCYIEPIRILMLATLRR